MKRHTPLPSGEGRVLTDVSGGLASGDQADRPLFRPEALAAAADSGLGRPIAKLPVSWVLLTAIMGFMLAAFMAVMLAGTYTRKETVSGLVSSTGSEARVLPMSAGVVKSVLVADGQHVRAGQTLVMVATLHSGLNGRSIDQKLLDNLDRELLNLGTRLRSLNDAAKIDLLGMPARLAALKAERNAVTAQERATDKRLSMAQEALVRLGPVADRGFISGETMRHHKEEVLVLQQAIADARGTEARLDGQISDLSNLAARQPMTVAQQRGELLDLIARTERDREAALGQRGFAVMSPTSGVVTTVQVASGQPVDPQMTLMTVSTKPTDMLAEVFVPSRAIGFLEPGQQVRLRYDAFPYQRFGVGTGRIKTISSTVLRPDQVAATIRIEEPVYRVVVRLDQDSVAAYGHRYHIRPGFALSADIVLEERTFAQWLLDPIVALRGRL